MGPETNNEIDLLLRRMARGNGAARDGAVQSNDRHLDADELSSYAQNALPPAARVRYMEHLADCATCRRLVTELSLSLGSAAVTAPVEAVRGPSGWKKFFASLFSPLVLRYAVPALGVIVVMVVGFVVLRRQGLSEFTARVEPRQAAAPTTTSETETPASKNYITNAQPKETANVESQNSTVNTKAKSQPASADDSVAGAAPTPPAREEKLMAETRPTATPDQPSAPAAKNGAAETEPQHETVTVAKKQPETTKEKAEAEQKPANEPARNQAVGQTDSAVQATPSPSSNTGFLGGLRGLSARRAETAKPAAAAKTGAADKDANTSTADEETRTVAGRHFRKQGKIWIDTAYESSTATVDMARNSEQFRALVADEPAIGTIARQLEGEVIVVWKGHAYRIR